METVKDTKIVKEVEKDSKKLSPLGKKLIIIASVLMALILVTGIILGLIKNASLSHEVLSDYLYVNIYDKESSVTPMYSLTKGDEQFGELFDEGMDKTAYSVLRGVFELTSSNWLKFQTEQVEEKTERVDDDGYFEKDDEGNQLYDIKKFTRKREVLFSDIASLTYSGAKKYVLEFVYGDAGKTKAINVGGEEVIFDRIRIVITNSENSVLEYTMYAYEFEKTYGSGSEVAQYSIVPLRIKANTTRLYENIGKIREVLKGSSDNGDSE